MGRSFKKNKNSEKAIKPVDKDKRKFEKQNLKNILKNPNQNYTDKID